MGWLMCLGVRLGPEDHEKCEFCCVVCNYVQSSRGATIKRFPFRDVGISPEILSFFTFTCSVGGGIVK